MSGVEGSRHEISMEMESIMKMKPDLSLMIRSVVIAMVIHVMIAQQAMEFNKLMMV